MVSRIRRTRPGGHVGNHRPAPVGRVFGCLGMMGLAIGAAGPALGQAVNITNGSTVAIPGPLYPTPSFETFSDDVGGYGFRSVNGSTINATGVEIITNGLRAVGIYASSGTLPAAQIRMDGGSIRTASTGGDGSSSQYGAYANGPRGYLELYGTSLSTAGARAYGLFDVNSAHVIADGVTITTTGQSAFGVHARGATGVVEIRNGSTIQTSGTAAPGVLSAAGATVNIRDSAVVTFGTSAGALGASADASGLAAFMNTSNIRIDTFGASASGVTAFQSGSVVTIESSTINTRGTNSYGLFAENQATINADGVLATTSGQGAFGVRAFADNAGAAFGTVNIRNSSITTSGTLAYGLDAEARGVVNATAMSIETFGSRAHGLAASLGGTINLAGATITTHAADAAGVAGRTATGQTNQFNLTDVTIRAAGDGYLSEGGTNVIRLMSGDVSAGSGIALNFAVGITTFTAVSSQIAGAASTGSTATGNLILQNATSWQVTGSSRVTNLTNDGSEIRFGPVASDPTLPTSFKTLTTNNYVGVGGAIVLNTHLADDMSPTDRLVINGGSATGNTILGVLNANGAGGLTTGNGILVVDVRSGGTSSVGAFALGGPVAAGAYEYNLYRGSVDASGTQSWYLRSTLTLLPPEPPVPPGPVPPEPVPPSPPTPQPPPALTIPDYRKETSLYAALPAMELIYGRTLIDSLHERIGDQRQADVTGGVAKGPVDTAMGWARVIGQRGDQGGGRLGIFGGGPAYAYDIYGLQAGLDLRHTVNADGTRDQAGFYAAYGQIRGDVDHFDGSWAGRNLIDAYSIGGYWTRYWPNGAYLDGVVQGTWYDADSQSSRDYGLKSSALGFAASLEGGYPLGLGFGWILEPQVQLVYQAIQGGTSSDAAAIVRFTGIDSLAGRLGVRLARSWALDDGGAGRQPRTLTTWLKAGVWNEFLGNPRTEFSSETGFIPFRAGLGGAWLEAKAGVDAQLASNAALYATVGYQVGTDGRSHAYEGRLGVKFTW